MNTSSTRLSAVEVGAWGRRLAPLRAWWGTLGRHEQRMALLALAVIGVFVVWALAVKPAWNTLRQAPAQLDRLDAQLQTMQRMAAETRELRAAPSIGTEQSAAALQAAGDRLGDRARLSVQGDRAVLSVNGITAEDLRNWLSEVRSGARARPIEAQLARGPQGFTGTVTLSFGGAP